MHVIYDRVAEAVSIPVLHIAEAVGAKMQADGIKSAALVGTRNVMTEKFYRQRLVSYGISLLPPDMDLAERVDHIVYDELVLGKISRESERFMKSELTDIAKQQVQAVVLACTELELIVDVRANVLPIYDSTSIHAQAALDFILAA
jgi:aspartate racemase